ncbi:FAD binding domain-containing protein [Aspergillus ambiguus]|uniref:FAD binding domain-containing protein n=1 Tax=Aspergillus ambiguus TaxID=176160 RepID=UPI003CCD1427
MAGNVHRVDLLIVGAGPSGLTAACWATQYNIRTRIIDQKETRTPTGHADGIQSRTMEILDSFGLANRILEQGVAPAEECYWAPNKETGRIERLKREASYVGQELRFGKVLLNQGAVEQVLLDYLEEKGQISVERSKRAESLRFTNNSGSHQDADSPIVVEVRDGSNASEGTEIIGTRYLIACDGAHSWTRNQLAVPGETTAGDSTWGVLDILPITDFPDIRLSCAIQSKTHGCIMTVPRENNLVRFYIYLHGDTEEMLSSKKSPRELAKCAEHAMRPFHLTFQHCDWWSLYKVQRQLVQQYRPHDRIFLAGDAAHSHSPMGGQGMNVSIQDSYNLMWKLGAVITGAASPAILDTYHSERYPVAKELLRLDSQLVQAYQEDPGSWNKLFEVLGNHAGFMSGVDVTYSPSILISKGYGRGATSIRLGMRIPSFPVVNQRDGARIHLAQALISNGWWRLLVCPGDLRRQGRVDALNNFAYRFGSSHHPRNGLGIETIVIHSSPRKAADHLGLPEIFHPDNNRCGYNHWRLFADEGVRGEQPGPLYQGYGIGEDSNCLILCRPDQHIAWIGSIEDVSILSHYLDQLVRV